MRRSPTAPTPEAGATVVSTEALYAAGRRRAAGRQSRTPTRSRACGRARRSSGCSTPLIDPQRPKTLADRGVTAISLDAMPRTLSSRADDGRAQLAGQRRRLQGGPHRGRRLRPLLPAADDGGRYGQARQRAASWASAWPGCRPSAPPRRLGAVVKAYDVRPETQRAGRSRSAPSSSILKSAVDATGEGGYARELTAEERAAQQAELNEATSAAMDVRHHHGPGPGPQAAGPRHRGRGRADEAGLGHRRHGGQRARRQRRAVAGRRDDRDRQRRDDHRARQPAGHRCRPARPPSTRATSRRCCCGMVQDGALHLDFERRGHEAAPSSPTAARSVRTPRKKLLEPAPPAAGGCRVSPELLNALAIFVLAILVGFEVISKVPATLHTPLMSGANSIHGIVLVGAMLIAAEADDPLELRPRVRRRRVRGDERRRRLRRHRPHAPDVPQEADGSAGTEAPDARSQRGASRCPRSGSTPSSTCAWLAGAACFVLGPAPDELAGHGAGSGNATSRPAA